MKLHLDASLSVVYHKGTAEQRENGALDDNKKLYETCFFSLNLEGGCT
jgi:hypothetical protein